MFEVEGRLYELRYDIKAIETLEKALNASIINSIQEFPTVSKLKLLLSFGLYNEHGNKVSAVQGAEIAEKIICNEGMANVFSQVASKLVEDCGFLFQGV